MNYRMHGATIKIKITIFSVLIFVFVERKDENGGVKKSDVIDKTISIRRQFVRHR